MSISINDFYRLLPIALKDHKYQVNKNIIDIDNGKIEINPGEEYIRRIASLKFPILKVQFKFTESTDDLINNFMEKFRRVYQKGGG